MKQLTNTIQQLKLNTNFAISVEDNTTKVTMVRNFTGKMLAETYGSVEGFFEDLKSKGVEDVKIIDKKNNFPGWRTIDSYNMKIQTSNGTPAIQAAPVQNNVPMAQSNNNNMSGLLAGLNMMDVSHKVGDYPRVITENDRLRIENEALKEKIAELKETVMENKFSDNKSSANNELLKSIAPLLAPLAEKILGGGGGPAIGLGTPQLPAATSPIKQSFFAMIQNTDDDFVQDLMLTAKGMSMEDPAFDNELTALVSKYQITL